jgi:hypothetical protein
MALTTTGTPFVGYISLTNAAPGPVAIALKVADKTVASLAPGQRIYITSIALSTNDTAQPKVTIDDGPASANVVASAYPSPNFLISLAASPGTVRCAPGQIPRAKAAAVTSAKTVECVISGYIGST